MRTDASGGAERDLAEIHRRWRRHETTSGAAFTQAMLRAARVEPGARVLDLACGVGEPALSLARAAGAAGRVTATDLDPAVVSIAQGNARADGVANVSFAAADAHQPGGRVVFAAWGLGAEHGFFAAAIFAEWRRSH